MAAARGHPLWTLVSSAESWRIPLSCGQLVWPTRGRGGITAPILADQSETNFDFTLISIFGPRHFGDRRRLCGQLPFGPVALERIQSSLEQAEAYWLNQAAEYLAKTSLRSLRTQAIQVALTDLVREQVQKT